MSDPMTNDVTNDLFNIAPMDFEPGLMEITIPCREPFIRESTGVVACSPCVTHNT